MRLYKTPVSEQGLKSLDHLSAADALVRAWTEEGRYPSVHRKAKRIVHSAMPLVARALDRLATAKPDSETAREQVANRHSCIIATLDRLATAKPERELDVGPLTREALRLAAQGADAETFKEHMDKIQSDLDRIADEANESLRRAQISDQLEAAREIYVVAGPRDPRQVLDVVEELLRSRGLIE